MLEEFGWIPVENKEKMEELFGEKFAMHDGMLKEFHCINRGYVEKDLNMWMGHSFDGVVFLQGTSKNS